MLQIHHTSISDRNCNHINSIEYRSHVGQLSLSTMGPFHRMDNCRNHLVSFAQILYKFFNSIRHFKSKLSKTFFLQKIFFADRKISIILKDIYKTTQPGADWVPIFDSNSNADEFEIKIASSNQHANLAFENCFA